MKVRKSTGLTQIKFAEEIGASQSAYKNYERDVTDAPLPLIETLCRKYSISADWLILGTGAENPKALYDILEQVVAKVRRWANAFPVPVPPEKEAQMVSVLLRYRLENENPSEAMEQFILDKAA